MTMNWKFDRVGLTLGAPVTIYGRGMHSGEPVRMSLLPARHPAGISFRIAGSSEKIPAHISRLTSLKRTVRLAQGRSEVTGVEHLLAAAGGIGICCLDIELSSGDVPGLDGSAQPFVHVMDGVGLVPCGGMARAVGGASVSIDSGNGTRITLEETPGGVLEIYYSIDFGIYGGPSEELKLRIDEGLFRRELAPARTFSITGHDRRALPGLDGPKLWTSSDPKERRFRDEFVRHKILDLLGDLVLVGAQVSGQITVHRGGHALHHRLAEAIQHGVGEK